MFKVSGSMFKVVTTASGFNHIRDIAHIEKEG